MKLFKKEGLCVHCNEEKTKELFEKHLTCRHCKIKILMERESIYECPADGAKMKKELNCGVIIDRCTKCRGVYLDADELTYIRDFSGNSDFIEGLFMGIKF